MPNPTLYPPRRRTENIELIRAVLAATSEAAFDAADAAIAASLHPSLFAELDWMERTVPPEQRERAGSMADGMFLQHLPALIAMRRTEFDLPDAALALEVHSHPAFYSAVLQKWPAEATALGPEVLDRIRGHLGAGRTDAGELAAQWQAVARSGVQRLLADVTDPDWLLVLVDVEATNAMAEALDHLSSRLDAKALVRSWGMQYSRVHPAAPSDTADTAGIADRLRSMAEDAQHHRLPWLAGRYRALMEAVEAVDPGSLTDYFGERLEGFGNCGSCSMLFASSPVVSLDPTCPGVFEADSGVVRIGRNLNVARCPFCGTEARIDAPSMYYSPRSNLVLYNVPARGFSEPEALEVHRPVIEAIRERYLARVTPAEAQAFEGAREEITYSMIDFLTAIQMGTTAREEHVANLVRFADGSGQLVDNTKGVLIDLTPQEVAERWAEAADVDTAVAVRDEGLGGGAAIKAAMQAYAARDFAAARRILEQYLAAHPEDIVARKNLAVLHVAAGDRDAARRLLRGTGG